MAHPQRILSLVPTARPVGFAYFEGLQLIDWGIRGHGGRRGSTVDARRLVDNLIRQYDPAIVLLPSTEINSRRPLRKEIVTATRKSSVKLKFATTRDVRRFFEDLMKPHRPTKHQMRRLLMEYFPELESSMPKQRRPWEPQDYWVPMFDAVAQAFAWKYKHG